MFPKDLKSIQTNLNPSDFHEVIGVLDEHMDLVSFQPSIEFEGSSIIKFFYAGRNYQMILEYGLLVSVMGL